MRVMSRSRLLSLGILVVSLSQSITAQDVGPVSVEFSSQYLGDDGMWSAAQIRVGSPAQYLSVFPATLSSETWVAGPGGCDSSSTCASLRGGLFYAEESTTWDDLGIYQLGFSELSQTTDNGVYGFDNLSISDTISTSQQVVAVLNDTYPWNGLLGLGVGETRFSSTDRNLAFLSTLVRNNSIIPSHSYGYTAGASYRGSGIQGSLTLGGVDASRQVRNDFWFGLASGFVPSVTLSSLDITASEAPEQWASSPLQVMSPDQAASFVIDSSTPYLWMPETMCDNIAGALNLTWNATLGLYTYGEPGVSNLLGRNIFLNFTFANSESGTLGLEISFDAFNLQLTYPYPGLFDAYTTDAVDYFPLRRANNTQQYIIGRAFLQEAYITVDYERNVFALSQAVFPDNSQQSQLVGIERPKNSQWPGPAGTTSSQGLSTGAKVGIAIGAVGCVLVVAALIWFFCVKRRRQRDSLDEKDRPQKTGMFSKLSKRSTPASEASASAAELNADKCHPTEMLSDSSNSRYELSAVEPAEMPAAEVNPTFFQPRKNTAIPQKNDPRYPVELVQSQRGLTSQKDIEQQGRRHRTSSSVPAYSPTGESQRHSDTVSPYSTRNGSNQFHGESDHIISPVTGSNSDRGLLGPGTDSRSGSGSDRLLSPNSPVQARSEGQSSSYSSTSSGSQGLERYRQSLGAVLAPTPERVPRRSPSRDSRFREELAEVGRSTITPAEQRSTTDGVRDDKSQTRSRLSWENRGR